MLRILAYISAITLALIAVTFLLWHAFDYQLLRIYSGSNETIQMDVEESEDPAEFIKDHSPEDLSIALNLENVKTLEAQNEIELSEKGYREALIKHQFAPSVTYQYATFLARKGDFSRAVTQLRRGGVSDDPEGLKKFVNCYETALQCSPLSTETQGDFWAHLINALEVRDFESSAFLLEQNPYRVASWHPDLLATLTYLVSYQQGRTLITFTVPTRSSLVVSPLTALVSELNALAELENRSPSINISSSMRRLLVSREAFALALSSAGLHEAAAKLHTEDTYPQEFPSWAALTMTRSLRKARGPKKAYDFALNQRQTDELQLEIGALLQDLGDQGRAKILLNTLSSKQSVIGADATLLLAKEVYRKGSLLEAKKMVSNHPRLSLSTEGKELLAKIALEQADSLDAEYHYSSIAAVSTDAKAYYVKKALHQKDYILAERLQEELLIDNPSL